MGFMGFNLWEADVNILTTVLSSVTSLSPRIDVMPLNNVPALSIHELAKMITTDVIAEYGEASLLVHCVDFLLRLSPQ